MNIELDERIQWKPCPNREWIKGDEDTCPTCHGGGRVPPDAADVKAYIEQLANGVPIFSERIGASNTGKLLSQPNPRMIDVLICMSLGNEVEINKHASMYLDPKGRMHKYFWGEEWNGGNENKDFDRNDPDDYSFCSVAPDHPHFKEIASTPAYSDVPAYTTSWEHGGPLLENCRFNVYTAEDSGAACGFLCAIRHLPTGRPRFYHESELMARCMSFLCWKIMTGGLENETR